MTDPNFNDSDLVEALEKLDIKKMSYVQLRRLNAALLHTSDLVARESAMRADDNLSGDTVRFTSPRFATPR